MIYIRRAWWIMAIGGLLCFLATLLLSADQSLLYVAAWVAPGILGISAVAALVLIARKSPLALISPVGPFAGIVLAYFCIGGLVPVIADAPTMSVLLDTVDFSAADLARVHGIVGLGILCVSLGVLAVTATQSPEPLVVGKTMNRRTFERSVVAFLVIGLPTHLLLTLPQSMGLFTFAAPDAFVQLGRLATLGVLLMGFGLARGLLNQRIYRPIHITTASLLVLTGVVQLSKVDIFIQGGAAIGGYFLANPSRKTALITLSVGVVVYVIIAPLIVVAREVAAFGGGSISARIEASQDVIAVGREILDQEDRPNIALLRISYVNVMAWTVDQYDRGNPGHSVTENALWMFVPRALFPEKPLVAGIGRQITYLVTDADPETSTGTTIFGEAYWNGGYGGLIVISFIVGSILGFLTIQSFNALTSLHPPAMLWVWAAGIMGERIDGFFLTDYIGPLVTWCVLYLAINTIFGLFIGSDATDVPASPSMSAIPAQ